MISVSLEMINTGKEEGGKKTMQGVTFEHTNRQLTPTRTACDRCYWLHCIQQAIK
jgi:hypothetical protein